MEQAEQSQDTAEVAGRVADRAHAGVECIESVADAVRRSVAAAGDKAVAVIPEGPYVVPRYVGA